MVKMTLLSYQLLKMFSLITFSGLKTLTATSKFHTIIRTLVILLRTRHLPFRLLPIGIAPIFGWSMFLIPKTPMIFPMAATFCHQQSTNLSLFQTLQTYKWMEVVFRGYNRLRSVNLNASIGAILEVLYLWMPRKLCSWKNNWKKMKGIIVWTQQIRCLKNRQMWEVQFLISERKFWFSRI